MWLVGKELKKLSRDVLPSQRQVLARFGYHHLILKKTIKDSATELADEIEKCWKRIQIPVCLKYRIVIKIKNLFDSWRRLKKNKENKKKAVKNARGKSSKLFTKDRKLV